MSRELNLDGEDLTRTSRFNAVEIRPSAGVELSDNTDLQTLLAALMGEQVTVSSRTPAPEPGEEIVPSSQALAAFEAEDVLARHDDVTALLDMPPVFDPSRRP